MIKPSVLLVDDEIKILSLLGRVLESHGFRVLTASKGSEALRIIDNNNIDVVLLDIVMPEMDGIDVLKRIVNKKPDLPVIMLTGHATIERAVEATKSGAFNFLEKPINSEKILITINNALAEMKLKRERNVLIQDALDRYKMVGVSPAIKEIFKLIEKAAPGDSTVLIMGESGSGKELIARAIHLRSDRVGGPFLVVNCAAIPENLIESELFGYERGAFTGALKQKLGKFEMASGGTLFLDEIGDMSLNLQAKLLRAFEDNELYRVGGGESVEVDTRIIAASNQDLKQRLKNNQFREDLYFRLRVITVNVPPLRKRREDIPVLLDHFMNTMSEEKKKPVPELAGSVREMLFSYDWPGNIRELKNFVETAIVLYGGEIISEEAARTLLESTSLEDITVDGGQTLSDARHKAERDAILTKLLAYKWNYEKTAEALGISRATLFNKIKQLRIQSKKLD